MRILAVIVGAGGDALDLPYAVQIEGLKGGYRVGTGVTIMTGAAAGRPLYGTGAAGDVFACDGTGDANILRFTGVERATRCSSTTASSSPTATTAAITSSTTSRRSRTCCSTATPLPAAPGAADVLADGRLLLRAPIRARCCGSTTPTTHPSGRRGGRSTTARCGRPRVRRAHGKTSGSGGPSTPSTVRTEWSLPSRTGWPRTRLIDFRGSPSSR